MNRNLKLLILLGCLGVLTLAALYFTSPKRVFENCITDNGPRLCVD